MTNSVGDTQPTLSPLEREVVEFFAHNAQRLGLARSLGELFGLLFGSPVPLPFEVFSQKLRLSRGSVSTGLRALQNLGAIRIVSTPGDRRTFYEVEMSLRKVVNGFLDDTVRPILKENDQMMATMRQLVAEERDAETRRLLQQRLSSVANYLRLLSQLLPLFTQAADMPGALARLIPRPEASPTERPA